MQSIGRAILKKGKEFGLSDSLLLQSVKGIIEKTLRETLGKGTERYLTNVFLQNSILFLGIKEATFSSEILLRKHVLKKNINESLGSKDLIKDIKFLKR